MIYLKQYSGPVSNANKSLKKSISVSYLRDNVYSRNVLQLINSISTEKSLFFWDFGKIASEYLQQGDSTFIVTKNDVYYGEIYIIINDPSGELGNAIGWSRQFKQPWQNVIGFKKINHRMNSENIREKLSDAIYKSKKLASNFYQLPNNHNLNDIFNGTATKVYKSFDERFNGPWEESKREMRKVVDRLRTVDLELQPKITEKVPTQLLTIINQINELKNSTTHSERDHESFAQKFFEYLGYRYPIDIRYRIGHMDIVVNDASENNFIIEVKRDWNLSRSSKDVIQQAYRYSVEHGSRFVVITNGDYYAFFDRSQGLSFQDNFDFEFTLTSLQDEDIKLLKKYYKSNL